MRRSFMKKMTHTPLLSIVVPVFNTEKYLSKCLDSIINQNIKNLEIILCNDMSTDHSEEIISEYLKRYDFIKYFKLKAKGMVGGARALGLANASGKYVGFVDSDDWVDANMYEKMINLADHSNADIAVCGVITEHEDLKSSEKRYEYKKEMIIDGKQALDLLTRQRHQGISISAITCNKLYRMQFLNIGKQTFLPNNFNDDDVFNFMCFVEATKVAISADTYYHYYQRQDSIMHYFSLSHFDNLIEGFSLIKIFLDNNNYYESLKSNYYAYFEKTLASIFNTLITHENDNTKLNECINYLFNKKHDFLIMNDYINYIGAQRIREFLSPMKRDCS